MYTKTLDAANTIVLQNKENYWENTVRRKCEHGVFSHSWNCSKALSKTHVNTLQSTDLFWVRLMFSVHTLRRFDDFFWKLYYIVIKCEHEFHCQGVSSKSSGNLIVSPNFCFSSFSNSNWSRNLQNPIRKPKLQKEFKFLSIVVI